MMHDFIIIILLFLCELKMRDDFHPSSESQQCDLIVIAMLQSSATTTTTTIAPIQLFFIIFL
jgi:hypothetical protein